MNIDFHTHTNLSKKIKTSIEGLEEKIKKKKEYKSKRHTEISIREHINATNIFKLIKKMQKTYPYEKYYYKIDEMKVFCSIEVDVKEKGHFLVIGSRDDILNISYLIIPYH